jgi:hypothetical protein
MRVVIHNPLWTVRDRYKCFTPEFLTYEGERLATPDWVESDSLCLSAPIPGGQRIIPLARVVSIDAVAVAAPVKPEKPPSDRVVRIQGDGGKEYLVTIRGGHRSCTCTGYGFRRKCKHLLLAE